MADNRSYVYRRLRRELGLTPAQAAGAIGGLGGESGKSLDPNAVNPTSGALGIGQWLGGRQRGVQKGNLRQQTDHLIAELKGPERSALNRLRGSHNINDATRAWVESFERPSAGEIASSMPARLGYARDAFRAFGSGGSGSGGGGSARGGGGPARPGAATRTTIETTPGVDNRIARGALVQSFLEDKGADVLDFAMQARQLQDIPATTTKRTVRIPGAAGGGRGSTASPSRLGATRGGGVAKITGPNPKRIVPQVRHFMQEISAVRGGKPVVGSDGTGHSYLTVNGNVSEHSTGHASDIPARGQELIQLGQAALIAAGWSRKRARAARGGLYNVNRGGRRYQIIFNTQEGGDHTDHLHVGVRG